VEKLVEVTEEEIKLTEDEMKAIESELDKLLPEYDHDSKVIFIIDSVLENEELDVFEEESKEGVAESKPVEEEIIVESNWFCMACTMENQAFN
jgi:hypothetical protein